MFLYNTLTKTKERLIPRHDKEIQMFVCGPTVYDYIHIGNARTFVFFDVVAKYLRSLGYEVDYIQNITDIDDKIIARAKENNRDPLEYAKEYYEKFKEDMKALDVDSPKYVPATEHIEQVVKQVKTLIDKGHAYLIENDGYYFDLLTFKDYGKLSGRKAQMADDAVSRIDENDKKRNRGDFCLWKLSKPEEPSWDTELGKGRPGWHIEDTAITEHFFGPQYDIHGGGQDLIFPHHEAEITQQESASGKKPFVKYWMHVGFLINKEQKMSKSLGNFETVNELKKYYSKEILRFYFLSAHYHSPLSYGRELMELSKAGIKNITLVLTHLQEIKNEGHLKVNENPIYTKKIDDYFELILKSMNNDFNTQEAFGILSGLISYTYQHLKDFDTKAYEKFMRVINFFDTVFGIITMPEVKTDHYKGLQITTSTTTAGAIVVPEITKLIEERERARTEKDYSKADKIRVKIKKLGFEIEDNISGPLVREK